MAIRLSIPVADITATMAAGYTHIGVYRSAETTSGFSEISTITARVALVAGVSAYIFLDGTGTTEHWYRVSFIDNNGVVAESAPSTVFHGTYEDTNFTATSYPAEAVFTSSDYYTIDRIRNLIGDPRELTRDYISTDTGYSSISYDARTLTLSNPKGWPLKVSLDGTEYTTAVEPRVNDYQFLTFSGTTINTVSGVLDVWYYHFRNSDTEILRTYNGLTTPAGLTADEVTFELSAVLTAIELLEKELRQFNATSSSEVDIYEEIRINPAGGISSRLADLKALRARRDELIDDIVSESADADLYGVLID